MGVRGIIMAAAAPFARGRNKSPSQSNTYNSIRAEYPTAEADPECGPSSSRRPLQNTTASSSNSSGGTTILQRQRPPSYGSTLIGSGEGSSKMRGSPERLRHDSLLRVPEDGAMEFEHEEGDPGYTGGAGLSDEDDDNDGDDWELEAELELEAQGLYVGSYCRLMALYTLVALTSIMTFTILAFLPVIAYPVHRTPPHMSYPYVPYLPFPIPEVLTATALWSLAHLVRIPLYSLSYTLSIPFPSFSPALSILLSTTLHTVVSTFIRLSAFPILLIPNYMLFSYPTWSDPAFRRVWWVALGWAAAEGLVGVKQGYEGIALYKDVLVKVRRTVEGTGKGVEVQGKGRQIYGGMEEGLVMGARELGSGTGTGPNTERSGSSSANTITTTGGTSSQHVLTPLLQIQTQGLPGRDERYPFPAGSSSGERELLLEGRTGSSTESGNGSQKFELENVLQMQVDRDLDQLMALKNREELEEVYGMPVIRIPVFISCLQRFNSVILSLGLTLLLSSAYLCSSVSVSLSNAHAPVIHPSLIPHSHSCILAEPSSSRLFTPTYSHVSLPALHVVPAATVSTPSSTAAVNDRTPKSNIPLLVTLPVVLVIHLILSTLYTPLVLPRIGVHTAVYVGLLISLGSFFAGLGMWEALS